MKKSEQKKCSLDGEHPYEKRLYTIYTIVPCLFAQGGINE